MPVAKPIGSVGNMAASAVKSSIEIIDHGSAFATGSSHLCGIVYYYCIIFILMKFSGS